MSKTTQYVNTISSLINYEASDWDVLQSERDVIITWAPELICAFYDTLYSIEDTRKVFHEGEREKLEATLEKWIFSILSGRQGEEFWDHKWYVALLHIKRGTKNLYMLGIMNRLQQVFLEKCISDFTPARALEVFASFLRISGMVAGLIAQCYDEVNETSTRDGLNRVGLNEALLKRIKDLQITKMLEEVQEAEPA